MHYRIVHNDIRGVYRSSRLVTADIHPTSVGFDRFTDLLCDANHLSGVVKSAFTDILGEAAWSCTYITAE